jgi:hypothetical protein
MLFNYTTLNSYYRHQAISSGIIQQREIQCPKSSTACESSALSTRQIGKSEAFRRSGTSFGANRSSTDTSSKRSIQHGTKYSTTSTSGSSPTSSKANTTQKTTTKGRHELNIPSPNGMFSPESQGRTFLPKQFQNGLEQRVIKIHLPLHIDRYNNLVKIAVPIDFSDLELVHKRSRNIIDFVEWTSSTNTNPMGVAGLQGILDPIQHVSIVAIFTDDLKQLFRKERKITISFTIPLRVDASQARCCYISDKRLTTHLFL